MIVTYLFTNLDVEEMTEANLNPFLTLLFPRSFLTTYCDLRPLHTPG